MSRGYPAFSLPGAAGDVRLTDPSREAALAALLRLTGNRKQGCISPVRH